MSFSLFLKLRDTAIYPFKRTNLSKSLTITPNIANLRFFHSINEILTFIFMSQIYSKPQSFITEISYSSHKRLVCFLQKLSIGGKKMKKWIVLCYTILMVGLLAACGTNNSPTKEPSETEAVNETNMSEEASETESTNGTNASEEGAYEPKEPTAEDLCAFCNMKIYTKDETMGVFTGQGVTKSGETLFFDDSGCILNYERKAGEELEQAWVRDYLTSEWIDSDSAIPVKSDVQTPMKYGYSFFADKESAQYFIAENSNLNPSMTDWAAIDTISNERYIKKMRMQKESNTGEMNHGEDQTQPMEKMEH